MPEIETEDATSTEPEVVESEPTEPLEGEADLGEPGKKALDAMKAERKIARDEAAAAKRELAEFKAAAALKDKPAEEQAIEAARAEARSEATQKANQRILKADLRAAATGKLADPTDAALYLDLSEFTVSDDGDTDSDALADAIDELIARKPHLAAAKQNRFDGAADQGVKGRDAKPPQLTEAELESMSYAEIKQARSEGRLERLLKTT